MKALTSLEGAPQSPKWVGLQTTCKNCGVQYELEATDVPSLESYENGLQMWDIPCPTCKTLLQFPVK